LQTQQTFINANAASQHTGVREGILLGGG